MKVIPVRHYRRGAVALCSAACVVLMVWFGFIVDSNIGWAVVREYIFAPGVLHGVRTTVELTLIGMAISLPIAIVLALGRMSESRILRLLAAGYVFVFRGIPIILLLIFVGNIGLFVKHITIGVPFTGLTLVSKQA